MKGIIVHGKKPAEDVFGPESVQRINRLIDLHPAPYGMEKFPEDAGILADAEVLFTVWGTPSLSEAFLDACGKLKLVIHVGGSPKGVGTQEFFAKGLKLSSTYAANAVPVAEYTLSQILFCLKRGWDFALYIKREGHYPPRGKERIIGAYGGIVGLISLGMIGTHVCQLLKHHDVKVIAYDPFLPQEKAGELNVELCSLDEVFAAADVVSLHTPLLAATTGMITGDHFRRMKPNASFINTSRGAVIREDEMVEVLKQREDIQAVLDVTSPEPPVKGSPLYSLPNVIVTPHIAGAFGNEPLRMGSYAADELERYVTGAPLKWEITEKMIPYMA